MSASARERSALAEFDQRLQLALLAVRDNHTRTRLINGLRSADLLTADAVLVLEWREIRRIKNLGTKSVMVLQEALRATPPIVPGAAPLIVYTVVAGDEVQRNAALARLIRTRIAEIVLALDVANRCDLSDELLLAAGSTRERLRDAIVVELAKRQGTEVRRG